MAYVSFKMGGGYQTKADATSIPDGALVRAEGCSFDTVGAVSSARGRDKLNSDTALAGSGSVLGHFDGQIAGVKYRFTKRGSAVYRDFTTDLGVPVELWPDKGQGTGVDFSTTSNLTGFAYGGYVYTADGTTTSRWSGTTPQTWGLTAPGYQELTANATPLATATSTTQTVTTTARMPTGMQSPTGQNIEIVGLQSVGGLPANQINKLHQAISSSSAGDVSVAKVGGGADTANVSKMTITFRRLLAAQFHAEIRRRTAELTGPYVETWEHTTPGGRKPPTDDVQTVGFVGGTGGFFSLGYSPPLGPDTFGPTEWTANIAYNASAATIQAALIALPGITGETTDTASTATTITSATSFTITTTTAATSTTSGGGAIGFIRQGPIVTITSTTGGALDGGKYYYAYAFYNGVAESNFSAQVPVVISTRGSYVTLTNIMPGPVGTTERRIYRTDVNGRQLYLIGKLVDNTTTTFADYNKLPLGADPNTEIGDIVEDAEFASSVQSQLSDREQARRRGLLTAEQDRLDENRRNTNLGMLSEWTDHDPPPITISEVGILNETVFGIDNGEVRFSKTGNPEHFPLDNRLKPGRNTSETALTWRPFDRDCIIYTESALYRFSQIGLDFSDSRFEEIESPVGLAGKRAIAQLDGQQGHVFLAKSGLYLFDGARVAELSYPIEKLFTDSTHENYINPTYMDSAWAATSRDRFYLSYGSDAANDRLLMCDFQDMQDPKFTVIPWALTTLVRERVDNTLVAGDASGYVYQLDTGYSDNGGNIEWGLTSKDYQLNEGAAFSLDEVVLDGDFGGATTTVTTTVRQRGTTKTCTHTVTTDGRQRVKLKVPTYMRGEAVTVDVDSADSEQRDLFALGFTYLPMGEP